MYLAIQHYFSLGLHVDTEDNSDLDRQFLQLEEIWNEREKAFTLQELVFHSWLKAYTLEVVQNGMLKEKIILAGLGCPFYTNNVESGFFVNVPLPAR